MIFAVFDVLLAVNMCINYSFLHLYLQFYYSRILKILKVCQVTLATPPYGVITHHLSDITRRGLSNKEKTECLALPVQK